MELAYIMKVEAARPVFYILYLIREAVEHG